MDDNTTIKYGTLIIVGIGVIVFVLGLGAYLFF